MDKLQPPDFTPWPEHLANEPLPHVVLHRAMTAARCHGALKQNGTVTLFLDGRSLPADEAATAVRRELADIGVLVEVITANELWFRTPAAGDMTGLTA